MIAAERIFEDRSALARALADDVAGELKAAIAARGAAVLAVSGGSTPKLFFEALSEADLPWPRVVVTLVDERQVPETSERSNARLVRETLLVGKAAAAKFVPLIDTDAAAALPPFDVTVLGMGTDGHTASFFPGGDRLAEAMNSNTPTRILEMKAPGAGEPRLTFTLPVLEATGRLKLHIEGAEKKDVLERALADGPTAEMPVRAVLRSPTPMTLYWAP